MIRTGDTIENTATGERLTFLATSADLRRRRLLLEEDYESPGWTRPDS